MAKKNTPPSSTFSRTARLLGAGLKIMGREAGHRAKDLFINQWDEKAPEIVKLRIEQATILSQNLSQLKGAAMKVGQLLSVDAADFLPPEAVEILSRLQSQAEVVDFEVMRKVLLDELGDEKFGQLDDLDTTAIAAASIGQVYRAKVRNQIVALKVQYPGVSESIHSDVQILRKTLQPFLRVTGRQIDLTETFAEIEEMLAQEVDYFLEAQYLKEYKMRANPYKNYVVPGTLEEFSTKKVLCMEWVEGTRIKDWLKKKPSMSERESIAKLVLDLYILEFFEWGLVQTDPNFGNFLIQEKEHKLVLLDFGSCKKFDRQFIDNYKNLLQTFALNEYSKTIDVAVQFGLIDARESEDAKKNLFTMLVIAMEPFQKSGFDFQDPDYNRRNRLAVLNFTSSLKYSPPPRQILFLHRKLGGIFNFAKTLGVKLDITTYWQKMISNT